MKYKNYKLRHLLRHKYIFFSKSNSFGRSLGSNKAILIEPVTCESIIFFRSRRFAVCSLIFIEIQIAEKRQTGFLGTDQVKPKKVIRSELIDFV